MDIATFHFKRQSGWSVHSFPELDSENTLILVFAAPEFIDNNQPLQELAKHYPKSKIIGCSSAGEIAGSLIMDDSINVAITRFSHTDLKVTVTEIQNAEDSYTVGKQISETLNEKNLKGIFILSEGLNVNGTELARGLNELNKENVVITGGLAGDGSRFERTWSICNDKILKNAVVAVGFYGDKIKIGHGYYGGWDIFGLERRITRAKNNILYELDNQPVLDLYKLYLGEMATKLPASGLLFPLSIRKNTNDSDPIVRTILGIDEKEKALIFAGDMPVGYLAQLMHSNVDHLVAGAYKAGQQVNYSLNSPHDNAKALAIAISCVGRRLLLGERSEEETEATLSSLPEGTQQIGFYSYGELSPQKAGICQLHNQTMTLTTICEE